MKTSNFVRFDRIVFALIVGLTVARTATAAPVLHFFSNAAYNANTATMDAALGTTGRPTDNFETTTLLPGLTITLSGGVPTTTEAALPALFDGDAFSSLTASQFWDGTHTASNAIGNLPNSVTSPTNLANLTTFNYSPGTLSFGIGLWTVPVGQLGRLLGHSTRALRQWCGPWECWRRSAGSSWTALLVRNVYVLIDSDVPILSVAFQNVLQPPGQQDFLMFDHLTVAATPSPRSPSQASCSPTASAWRHSSRGCDGSRRASPISSSPPGPGPASATSERRRVAFARASWRRCSRPEGITRRHASNASGARSALQVGHDRDRATASSLRAITADQSNSSHATRIARKLVWWVSCARECTRCPSKGTCWPAPSRHARDLSLRCRGGARRAR